MTKTVAIYEEIDGEMLLRLGTFTPRKFYSARAIGEQVRAKHPNLTNRLFMSHRMLINGQWTDDGQRIPLD
jgi:hypothetical protein